MQITAKKLDVNHLLLLLDNAEQIKDEINKRNIKEPLSVWFKGDGTLSVFENGIINIYSSDRIPCDDEVKADPIVYDMLDPL